MILTQEKGVCVGVVSENKPFVPVCVSVISYLSSLFFMLLLSDYISLTQKKRKSALYTCARA